MMYSIFVSCPKGFEYLLEEELRDLGLAVTRVSPQGVYGEASLEKIYHLCLWSRIANRVQWLLFSGEAQDEQALYRLCHDYAWQTVFNPEKTFAIEFHGTSEQIRNSMYGGQLVKDAIADYFRQFKGFRPNVLKENPDVRIHAHLKNNALTVSVDMTGYSLHQRGYRGRGGVAPIKENVAAALLMRAKWPLLAEQGYGFCDPFCGSGTLVIEAAMMASHIAPGLLRTDQALVHLVNFKKSLWEQQRLEASQQIKLLDVKFCGGDENSQMIESAIESAALAGVGNITEFKAQSYSLARPASETGLLISNPPYGERLGEANSLIPLYQGLGETMHAYFKGWQAAVLTSNPMLSKAIGLRCAKQYAVYNGQIECKLYTFSLDEDNRLKQMTALKLTDGAQMFFNRLKKNVQHLEKWAKREEVSCYRVYDADLPEYAFAIDRYQDAVVIQEYAPPATVPEHKAEQRVLEVMQIVPQVLGVAAGQLVMKTRKKQKGRDQYEKISSQRHELTVSEGRARFKVNLSDYLDTGLFLDHRPLRLKFANLEKGQRFLNCFCYTATASVHAALAGAVTTSVDLSNTYLRWAEDNFCLNQLNPRDNQLIQADCLTWLKQADGQYDVIFMDPPSFSNSKRMTTTLDIARDHEEMIELAMGLLAEGGVLYFSTNLRQFKLSAIVCDKYKVNDITAETIDLDFKRNTRIHHCFEIRAL